MFFAEGFTFRNFMIDALPVLSDQFISSQSGRDDQHRET